MEGGGRKKQVIFEQLVALLEFLRKHEDLAKGLTRGRHRRGKVDALKAWDLCAKKLNSIKDGAVKDGKGWSKYWCDWKYRAKRRALELRAYQDSDSLQPEDMFPLTDLEESILTLIGKHAMDDVVIINDPLSEDVELNEALEHYGDHNEDSTINQYFEDAEPVVQRCTIREITDDGAGPSCPPERNPTVQATTSGNMQKVETRLSKRRRTHRSLTNSDTALNRSNSPLEKKPKVSVTENANAANSDGDDQASAFLILEREKVLNSGKIVNTLEMIHSEIARMTSIMADIKDYVMTNVRQIDLD